MRKKAGGALVLLASTIWLAGCINLRSTPPCYGFGCGIGSKGTSGQTAQNTSQKSSRGKALATNRSTDTSQAKQGE